MVIDQTLEPLRLSERVFFDNPERERISEGSWEFLWNGIPLKYGDVYLGGNFGPPVVSADF
jgi:hypothetical protein